MTILKLMCARLESLCRAAQFDAAAAIEMCETLLGPTGHRPIGSSPLWRSGISDDHTPVELSIGFDGTRADPRFLVESLGAAPTLQASWEAGRATSERLRDRYGAALERLSLVEDVFLPRNPEAHFAMWHAAWLRPGRAPLFKVYLNPAADGPERAPALVREALKRLDFGRAWGCLEAVLARRPSLDQLVYFSLDLDDSAEARVKVYVAHPGATESDIEPLLALSAAHAPGDGERFCRAMTGMAGPYNARPLLTCYAFTGRDDTRPASVTLHVPIRSYVADDRVALERISSYLGDGLGATYRRVVEAVAHRPLEAGVGLQTYASFRGERGARRATAYLALEAYATEPPRVAFMDAGKATSASAHLNHKEGVVEELAGQRARREMATVA
jgi:DMATS type aromatic prenyltransferase